MSTTQQIKGGSKNTSNIPTIALRIGDNVLYDRIKKLSQEQNISVNLAVNMLLGFAFNEVDSQDKKFVPKIIFETN